MISSGKTALKTKSKSDHRASDTALQRPEFNNQRTRMPDVSPRVAVLVDTSNEWGRRLVKGVSSYAIKHGPWKLWVNPTGQVSLPSNWNGAGVIAPLESAADVQRLSRPNRAIVNVSAESFADFKIPTVTSNVETVAELSLSHFNQRGLKNYAFVGPLQRPCVRRQASAFQKQVRDSGFNCEFFDCVFDSNVVEGWGERRQNLVNWLSKLPKPTGIFTWNTISAIDIVDACSNNGMSVPDDISVLAGDDDTLLCNTTSPTLSGILTASEQIGFAAAKRLDAMLNPQLNGQAPGSVELIDPIMINSRQSTDSLAINDPDLLSAVRFIRMNACCGITVQEVADSVPIGRRSLERKFKECFGRTPLDEIQRLRLGRVRELLVQTDLPISKIAKDAGFGTPEYMTTMFKCRFGLTPLKFRSQSRAR